MTKKLVIVGSGPAGYTAAIYGARGGYDTTLVAGYTPGGALMNTTLVENFPGFPEGIQGPDLMENMLQQVQRLGVNAIEEEAEVLHLQSAIKRIELSDDSELEADAVILAMGANYRKLGVPGEAELSAKGVSYCATCDGPLNTGQRVVVIGGGDSALEEATHLAKMASEVTVIHRRDEFRASQAMQGRLRTLGNVDIIWNTQVQRVLGDAVVTGVELLTQEGAGSVLHDLGAEGVFVAIGHDPCSELLEGQVLLENGYVATAGGTQEVLRPKGDGVLPGVFVCGDLADARYRQAVTAAGSGCAAALDAGRYLETVTA